MSVVQIAKYLEQKSEVKEKDDICMVWRKNAYECIVRDDKIHDWMPTSFVKSASSEHVTRFMCKACLHEITMDEMTKYRYRLF